MFDCSSITQAKRDNSVQLSLSTNPTSALWSFRKLVFSHWPWSTARGIAVVPSKSWADIRAPSFKSNLTVLVNLLSIIKCKNVYPLLTENVLAPYKRSLSTASTCPLTNTKCNVVRWYSFCSNIEVPCFSSKHMISYWPICATYKKIIESKRPCEECRIPFSNSHLSFSISPSYNAGSLTLAG